MKTELTEQLEKAIRRHTKKQGVFGCFEVTIGWFGKRRVDYMTYDTNGTFRCYEIKSSVSDFRSENGHTFVGDYGYYVMPEELFPRIKEDVAEHIGVFILTDKGSLVSVKKAEKQIPQNPDILLQSLLRSTYREAEKVMDSDEEPLINGYKRALARVNRELKNSRQSECQYRQDIVDLKRVLRANGINPNIELDKLQEECK